MEAGGEEKQRQTQNNLALLCGEGERQTRMEHMDKTKTGSKESPTVEGGTKIQTHASMGHTK